MYVYMKIPEVLEVDREPLPGEDPKRWVVRLLKGPNSIKYKSYNTFTSPVYSLVILVGHFEEEVLKFSELQLYFRCLPNTKLLYLTQVPKRYFKHMLTRGG